jgi:hypothetical protein
MWAEQGSLDAEWNTRDHFRMRVLVSPTGNGFLLDLSREPIEFRTRDGHVVSSYRRSARYPMTGRRLRLWKRTALSSFAARKAAQRLRR